MTIQVGSKVRSFDFNRHRDLEGSRACYAEGEVVGFKRMEGCERYIIEVSRLIVGGEEQEITPGKIYPPVNGTRTWSGEVTNGVESIT